MLKDIKLATENRSIAVVEDDIMMTQFLSIYFGDRYDLRVFPSVEEFLAKKSEYTFHAMWCDLNIGELNGSDLIHIVRNDVRLKYLPLIMLSGEDKSEARIECLRHGADDFLIKPFNPEELHLRTQNLMKLKNNYKINHFTTS